MEHRDIIRGLLVVLVLAILLLGSCVNALRHSWLDSAVSNNSSELDQLAEMLRAITGELQSVAPADVQRDVRHLTDIVEGREKQLADFDAFAKDIEYKMRDRFTGTDAEAMREEIKAWVRQTIDQALKDRNGKAEAPEQANSGDGAKRGAAAT